VKYVVEIARALASMPQVYRVDLLTRQIVAPGVDWSYEEPSEMISSLRYDPDGLIAGGERGRLHHPPVVRPARPAPAQGGAVDWSYGEPSEMLSSLRYDPDGLIAGESAGAYIIRLPCGPRDQYLRKEALWPYVDEFVDGALTHIMHMSRELADQIGDGQRVWPYMIHGHYADAGDIAALLSGQYLRKEALWPYVDEFLDGALTHIMHMSRELADQIGDGQRVWPYMIHGHYADAGDIAALLSGGCCCAIVFVIPPAFVCPGRAHVPYWLLPSEQVRAAAESAPSHSPPLPSSPSGPTCPGALNVPMVLTGHSLGRNNLEQLLKQKLPSPPPPPLPPPAPTCPNPSRCIERADGADRRLPGAQQAGAAAESTLSPFLLLLPCPPAPIFPGALNVPMVLTGHSLGRNKLEQLLKQGRMSRAEINTQYAIDRRIEAEEFSLDAAELVVTSTRQEVEEQWGLYDGFDVRLERVLRARQLRGVSCHGRFMPRMAVSTHECTGYRGFRIDAEEFSLDAAELVVTSTRQEVEEQWGLYDGFDVRLERVLRARQLRGVSCHGRFMPRMVVIPPGMDFSNVVVPDIDGSDSPGPEPPIWAEVRKFWSNPHKPIIMALPDPTCPLFFSPRIYKPSPSPSSPHAGPQVLVQPAQAHYPGPLVIPPCSPHLFHPHHPPPGPPLTPPLPSPTQVRKFWSNPHKPIILALARPDPKKNLTTLVRAFGECQALRDLANLCLVMGNRDDIHAMSAGNAECLVMSNHDDIDFMSVGNAAECLVMGNRDDIDAMSAGNAEVLTTVLKLIDKYDLYAVLKLIDKYDLYGQVAYPKHHKQAEVPDIYALAAKSKAEVPDIYALAAKSKVCRTVIQAAVLKLIDERDMYGQMAYLKHLAYLNTWPTSTPGLPQHLAYLNTWPTSTPGLPQHLAYLNTWPTSTPGLPQHLAYLNTWPTSTPGLPQHLAYLNTWPTSTPGLPQHLAYLNTWPTSKHLAYLKTPGLPQNTWLQTFSLVEPFGLTLIESSLVVLSFLPSASLSLRFILPVHSSPFTPQAAAHGLPMVATKNGGPVDIQKMLSNGLVANPHDANALMLSNGLVANPHDANALMLSNGLVVDPHDANALAEALLQLVADRALWTDCRKSALANIHKYSWPQLVVPDRALWTDCRKSALANIHKYSWPQVGGLAAGVSSLPFSLSPFPPFPLSPFPSRFSSPTSPNSTLRISSFFPSAPLRPSPLPLSPPSFPTPPPKQHCASLLTRVAQSRLRHPVWRAAALFDQVAASATRAIHISSSPSPLAPYFQQHCASLLTRVAQSRLRHPVWRAAALFDQVAAAASSHCASLLTRVAQSRLRHPVWRAAALFDQVAAATSSTHPSTGLHSESLRDIQDLSLRLSFDGKFWGGGSFQGGSFQGGSMDLSFMLDNLGVIRPDGRSASGYAAEPSHAAGGGGFGGSGGLGGGEGLGEGAALGIHNRLGNYSFTGGMGSESIGRYREGVGGSGRLQGMQEEGEDGGAGAGAGEKGSAAGAAAAAAFEGLRLRRRRRLIVVAVDEYDPVGRPGSSVLDSLCAALEVAYRHNTGTLRERVVWGMGPGGEIGVVLSTALTARETVAMLTAAGVGLRQLDALIAGGGSEVYYSVPCSTASELGAAAAGGTGAGAGAGAAAGMAAGLVSAMAPLEDREGWQLLPDPDYFAHIEYRWSADGVRRSMGRILAHAIKGTASGGAASAATTPVAGSGGVFPPPAAALSAAAAAAAAGNGAAAAAGNGAATNEEEYVRSISFSDGLTAIASEPAAPSTHSGIPGSKSVTGSRLGGAGAGSRGVRGAVGSGLLLQQQQLLAVQRVCVEDEMRTTSRRLAYRVLDIAQMPTAADLRRRLRLRGLRCHVGYCRAATCLHILPLHASRSQALRYLCVRWGLEPADLAVVVGSPAGADGDYAQLLSGMHHTLILEPPPADVAQHQGAAAAAAAAAGMDPFAEYRRKLLHEFVPRSDVHLPNLVNVEDSSEDKVSALAGALEKIGFA
ncbi:unnamed protein product, partial [Closterium sp. Naga37s-1]